MSSTSSSPTGRAVPAWEIARLFPLQGHWSDAKYLSFTESLSQMVEVVDGRIEVLEMPTKSHQKIVIYLLNLIMGFLKEDGLGEAISAPYRVRLRDETFREPDIVVYLTKNLDRFGERYGDGADLVVEVVSEDAASRTRDYEEKRSDYAKSKIPEYWIVDPFEQRITVLTLAAGEYSVHGEFRGDSTASSVLLEGFTVSMTNILEAV